MYDKRGLVREKKTKMKLEVYYVMVVLFSYMAQKIEVGVALPNLTKSL